MHPSVPKRLRLALVLATIAALLAIPSLTAAAPKGSGVTFEVTALTPTVSINQAGAFQAYVANNGTATLTHATLTATVSGATFAGLPAGCGGSPVVCDLGTLAAGDSRTLVFVVTAPGAAGSVVLDATLQVDAGKNNSSLDEFSSWAEVAVSASTTFFGRWQAAGAAFAGGVASAHQTSTANVPAVGFNYAGTIQETGASVCGVTGIGQGVSMNLAGGTAVSPYLTVTLTYDAVARGNRTPGNVGFVHLEDDGDCTFLLKGCATAGCFNAWWDGNGPNKNLVVQALLPHNGIVKGF